MTGFLWHKRSHSTKGSNLTVFFCFFFSNPIAKKEKKKELLVKSEMQCVFCLFAFGEEGGGCCRVGWLNLFNAVLSSLFCFHSLMGVVFVSGGLLVHVFLFGYMYLFVFTTQRKVGEEIQTYITLSWCFCPVWHGNALTLCPLHSRSVQSLPLDPSSSCPLHHCTAVIPSLPCISVHYTLGNKIQNPPPPPPPLFFSFFFFSLSSFICLFLLLLLRYSVWYLTSIWRIYIKMQGVESGFVIESENVRFASRFVWSCQPRTLRTGTAYSCLAISKHALSAPKVRPFSNEQELKIKTKSRIVFALPCIHTDIPSWIEPFVFKFLWISTYEHYDILRFERPKL